MADEKDYCGIGVETTLGPPYIVKRVGADSPAALAGIRRGDLLSQLLVSTPDGGQRWEQLMRLDDVKGPPGTLAHLRIDHGSGPVEKTIPRNGIDHQSLAPKDSVCPAIISSTEDDFQPHSGLPLTRRGRQIG